MIGKTVDDIRPPRPLAPSRDPLEADNRFVHNPRPGPGAKRPAKYVAEDLRPTTDETH